MSKVIRAALIALALLAGGLSVASAAPPTVNLRRLQEAVARYNALQAQEQAALRQVQLARTPAQRAKALLAAQVAGAATRKARETLQNVSRDNRR